MSLVGTRPPTVDEWDKYELHHRARLATNGYFEKNGGSIKNQNNKYAIEGTSSILISTKKII